MANAGSYSNGGSFDRPESPDSGTRDGLAWLMRLRPLPRQLGTTIAVTGLLAGGALSVGAVAAHEPAPRAAIHVIADGGNCQPGYVYLHSACVLK